jgi:3-hydroxyisobutyrate dehydrogenase
MPRVGLVGLGLMGTPMSKRILDGGFTLTVWNRTPDRAKPVLDAGASWVGRDWLLDPESPGW